MDELIDKIKKFQQIKLIVSIFSAGGCLPLLLSVFVVFVGALLLLGFLGASDEVANEEECVPVKSADMICESITVNGKTMDVDEYVAGVVMAEVGHFNNLESEKAVAVAARTYALHESKKDDSGNCDMGTAGQSSQAYSGSPNSMATQAANDTSGMILVDDSGKAGFTQYDAFAWTEEKDGYFYVSQGGNEEKHQKIPSDWVHAHQSSAELEYNKINSHGNGLSQVGSWYLADKKGYDYEKILDFYYSDEGYSLATTGGGDVTEICTGGNLQTLDHYNTGHQGLNKLTSPLSSSEIADLNAYLDNEIKKAGHGSGAAVAAAGQGLVYWLETQKTAYLGYYWGGGHGDTVIGGDPKWGTNVGIAYTYRGNPTGPEYGMDCSGFVSWATRIGCNPGFGSNSSDYWNQLGTGLNSLSQTEPGDVITNDDHIMMVVKNNGDGTAYIAQETRSQGLVFSLLGAGDVGGYYIRSMKSWYAKNCTDIQPPSNVDSGGGSGSGGGSSSTDDLGKQIKSYIESNAAKGDWGVYVKNLKTGKTSTYNASKSMVSASVIKLFIAGAVYEKVNQHTLSEDTIAGDMRIMIENSNNDAANRLKDAAGGYEAVNNYASSHGYSGVGLHREFSKTGPENMITPRAVGKFLEDVHKGRVVNSTYSNKILGHMRNQKTLHKIPAGLGCSNCSASKSGELPDRGVANDAAIVYSPKATYVIVVLSQTGAYSTAEGNIREISKLVYDYYN